MEEEERLVMEERQREIMEKVQIFKGVTEETDGRYTEEQRRKKQIERE